MSRDIKFRAWMEDANADWTNEDCEDRYEMIYDFAYEEYSTVNDMLRLTENLMQYTGLKDKNGVEIYEGDIVKNYFDDENYQIIFKGGCFVLYSEEYFIHPNNLAIQLRENDIEVIGNIYENSELLK